MRPFNAQVTEPVPGFGRWPSPVTPDAVIAGGLGFSELQVDGEAIYWLEQRAAERGRRALVRWTADGGAVDVLPESADVGTKVHEYGGGALTAGAGRIVYSERGDGSVWLVEDGRPRPLVSVPGCRYAGFALDLPRRRVYAVREDHRGRPFSDPANAVVSLALDPADPAANAGTVLFGASDFVLAPQLAPGGDRLAFVAWNHPNMPWDATRLVVLALDEAGAPGDLRAIAGTVAPEAIVAAAWAPDGDLLFASDRTGWWNLYAWDGGGVVPLAPIDAETALPPWVLGLRSFVPLAGRQALAVVVRDAVITAARVAGGTVDDLPLGRVAEAPVPFGAGAVFIATSAGAPAAIRLASALDDPAPQTLRSAAPVALDPADVSIGEPYAVPTSDGETTYVVYYPPRNARVAVPDGALPPLVVMSHGGPTSLHVAAYDLQIQWWTTRGFAVAHVNYRGSTGYGSAYRRRLAGEWGVLDVIDCVSAARWLAAAGRCDGTRMVIRGRSASGMTALMALATSDAFAGAASHFGVTDMLAITIDSHKFELRYADSLIGPLPEARERYRERSPVAHAATIDAPVLILQGLDDHVVPPSQATAMRDALAARGVRAVYEEFAGEGHGFRKGETIRRVLDLELDFFRDVLGLQ